MNARLRTLLHWEFPDDGGAAAAVAPAAEAGAVPPPDPASGSLEPGGEGGPPSPEAAAPAWANDPAFHDAVADTAQQVAAAMFDRWQQSQQQPVGYQDAQVAQAANPFDPQAFDPFSDQFGSALAGAFQSMQEQIARSVQDALAPLAQQQQQRQEQELQQRVRDVAAAVVSSQGEWPVGDDQNARAQANEMMLALATQLAPAEVERYGPGHRAVEAAMAKAHRQVMDLLSAAGGHGQSTYRNQLSTLGGVPPEPSSGGTGFPQPVTRGDEIAVARAYGMRSIGR